MSQLCDGCLVALTSDQRYHLCRVRLTVAALLLAVQPAGKSCPSRMALLFYIFSTQFDWDAFEMLLSCVLEERVRRSISEYWSSAASPLLSTSLTLKPRRCSFQYYSRQSVILSQRVHTWQTSRTNASPLTFKPVLYPSTCWSWARSYQVQGKPQTLSLLRNGWYHHWTTEQIFRMHRHARPSLAFRFFGHQARD